MHASESDATLRDLAPGRTAFGRYVLKKMLGRGGSGVVWLARDLKLEEDVALKFLPEIIKHDALALDDLKQETKRARQLSHPHIVRVYDFLEDTESAAIAMEPIEGGTLAKLRVEKPNKVFSVDEIALLVRDLCEALDYAHREGRLVHRDLKPGNLMVDSRGRLKVADFSIARSISNSVSRISNTTGFSGTPVYMSPQQMMGAEPAVTDDVYALGASIYELLTGRPPFYSGDIFAQVQNRVPVSMTDRRMEFGVAVGVIPPAWEAVMAACLAKDPAKRPQSAGEVARRLGLPRSRSRIPWGWGRSAEPFVQAVTIAESSLPSGRRRFVSRLRLYIVIAVVAALAGGAWYFSRVYSLAKARSAAAAATTTTRSVVVIAPMKTSVFVVGSLRLTVGEFERDGDRLSAGYEAKVLPFLFLNESGRASIILSEGEVRRLAAGEARPFVGEAVSQSGAKRRIEGRAEPVDAGRGEIRARVFVGNTGLVFNTTYRFTQKE